MRRLGPGVTEEGHAACCALVAAVAWQEPAFLPSLAAHLEEMDGEVLPHLLLADYLDRCLRLAERSDFEPVKLLGALLDEAVERNIREVRDMVQVSFVEHLQSDDARSLLRPLLGTRARTMLDE